MRLRDILRLEPKLPGLDHLPIGYDREPSLLKVLYKYYENGFADSRGSMGDAEFEAKVQWHVDCYVEMLEEEIEIVN